MACLIVTACLSDTHELDTHLATPSVIKNPPYPDSALASRNQCHSSVCIQPESHGEPLSSLWRHSQHTWFRDELKVRACSIYAWREIQRQSCLYHLTIHKYNTLLFETYKALTKHLIIIPPIKLPFFELPLECSLHNCDCATHCNHTVHTLQTFQKFPSPKNPLRYSTPHQRTSQRRTASCLAQSPSKTPWFVLSSPVILIPERLSRARASN
jgi:hypothetical protein